MNRNEVLRQSQHHNPYSPLLVGEVTENDDIYQVDQSSSINMQLSLKL